MKQKKTSRGTPDPGARGQNRKTVPNKPLRAPIAAAVVVLLVLLVFGIVCSVVALTKRSAAPAAKTAENAPEPVAATAVPSVIATPENETIVSDTFTPEPTKAPTPEPTEEPTLAPTEEPTPEPTEEPTPEPEITPTSVPTPYDYDLEPYGPDDPIALINLLAGRTFREGDADELILDVQSTLMDLGYLESDEPNDYFGPQTVDALVNFQRHNGLAADGELNEETFLRLMGNDAKEYVMQEGDAGDDVREVQERLYELGYLDRDSRTSSFGEKTASAVRAFQSANKLKVDGMVSAKTMNALYSGDVVGNYYKAGDSDESIVPFQQQLQKLGYLDAGYDCTGEMDEKTVAAIKTFQEANGLVRDGCLGPATTDLLNSKKAVAYAIRIGMSGADVRTAQQRLYELGYIRASQITGYYGESTEEAVKSFQKRNKLSRNGEIDSKTLEKLNSSSAKAASAPATKKPKTQKPGKPTPTPNPGDESAAARKGIEKLIKIAEEKLGCKYVRGAKGPNEFDCSGFVYWCLNQAGVKQGYMSSVAWRSCSKYKRINYMSELKRGDILVFKGINMSRGHVGIYLGDGKMIDASTSQGVIRITEESILTSKYWQEHFLMAYRIWG
jgi:peptidoglycan hydrolase-like protein with peptidoglycan-binding domain